VYTSSSFLRRLPTHWLASLLSLILLVACSGGGSSGTDSTTAATTEKTAASTEKATGPQTIFTDQTPALTDVADGVAYEMGLRFQAKVDGKITAIRYWKASSETSSNWGSVTAHKGLIWADDSGRSLSTAWFQNETASGWQEAKLTMPLFIQKGVTYTVSVESNSHYAFTEQGLNTALTNSNLVALEGGGVYGSLGKRPTQTYQNSHYFRDVVFEPHEGETIFSDQTPADLDKTDSVPACQSCVGKQYELGIRFTAATDGEVLGMRYWRAPSETLKASEVSVGNVGRLWSPEGTQLATAIFDGASNYSWPRNSGWQYAYFYPAVKVVAGQTYTASVYVNSHYVITQGGLATAITNGSLTALVDGGVFSEVGATYPTQTWASSNYFRDVLFRPAVSTTTP
jgi:hypothetical protein